MPRRCTIHFAYCDSQEFAANNDISRWTRCLLMKLHPTVFFSFFLLLPTWVAWLILPHYQLASFVLRAKNIRPSAAVFHNPLKHVNDTRISLSRCSQRRCVISLRIFCNFNTSNNDGSFSTRISSYRSSLEIWIFGFEYFPVRKRNSGRTSGRWRESVEISISLLKVSDDRRKGGWKSNTIDQRRQCSL